VFIPYIIQIYLSIDLSVYIYRCIYICCTNALALTVQSTGPSMIWKKEKRNTHRVKSMYKWHILYISIYVCMYLSISLYRCIYICCTNALAYRSIYLGLTPLSIYLSINLSIYRDVYIYIYIYAVRTPWPWQCRAQSRA